MSKSNNGPVLRWISFPMANGTIRHRLYVNGAETPFFIDHAKVKAHFADGHAKALWGAGMGKVIDRPGGGSYRIAGFLKGGSRIGDLKQHAEQRALAELEKAAA